MLSPKSQEEICKEMFCILYDTDTTQLEGRQLGMCMKFSYSTWVLTGNVLLNQVMRIVDNVRPDRQTVMFSATFPRAMEALARRILSKPIEVQVGGRSVVCSDVEQHVVSITHTPCLSSFAYKTFPAVPNVKGAFIFRSSVSLLNINSERKHSLM